MSILAFFTGLLLPALCGWLLVSLLEGRTPVLLRLERWTLGLVLGLLLSSFLFFCAQEFAGIPFTRSGMIALQWVFLITLFVVRWLRPMTEGDVSLPPSPSLSRNAKILIGVLAAWVVLKTVIAGATFLLLTPTYLDDTLDNWNLRGKVFFVDQTLTLVMPNEDPVTSPRDISSYPPSVPLMKTWLSVLAGNWNDPLVNSIHLVWYVAALILLFSVLRRKTSLPWALLGTYLLASLPLYLMHGTNTYADAFLSVHVFAAIGLLFSAITATSPAHRLAFLRLGAVAAAVLPFTKNEGLLVYLPPLLVIVAASVWWWLRTKTIDRRTALQILLWYGMSLLLILGPWLAFKWMHGLTFGNGKAFTSLGFGWQENVLLSIFINTFFEGNWLLLFPLFFGLLAWRWRRARTALLPLTAFFLMVYVGQGLLYLFTGLSAEALRQTGYARGLIHLAPMIVLLTTLLLKGEED